MINNPKISVITYKGKQTMIDEKNREMVSKTMPKASETFLPPILGKEEVFIITPTFNNEDYTLRCFESIWKNTTIPYKIVWIDNGSTKKSREKVKSFLDENSIDYELIANEENLGFVKATNQGMKRAMEFGAKYVVLQNNDTEVYDGWLDRMIEVAESDPRIGLVGPITSPCDSWQSIENLRISHSEFNELPEYKNNPKEYAQIIKEKYKNRSIEIFDYLAFFSVLIKKDAIAMIGLLSEDFGVGFGDDNDYCARARKDTWKLYLASDVFVFHNHRSTFKSIYSEEEIRKMLKNAQYICNHKYGDFLKTTKQENFLRISENDSKKCPYCGKEANKNHILQCEKNAPLVSVIVPSRVGEEIDTLTSLKTQTYKNLEIIVEYDEKQEGASATRNRGAAKAKGKYLFFCDNDIVLSPSCISDLYLALISDPGAKWSFGKFIIDGKLYNENKISFPPKTKKTIEWMFYFFEMSTMSLIDARANPHFDDEMKRFNDWDLWLTLNEKGYRGVFCDKVLFVTENRKSGISKSCSEDSNEWTIKLFSKHNVDILGGIFNFQENIRRRDQEIQQKSAQISHLEELNRIKEKELFEIRSSLRWKIPNFIYKIYKNKLKKFIPRFFFDLARPLFVYLDKLKHGQINSNNRFKLDLKKIEKLKLDSVADLHFKKTAKQKVSIIIPVYNKWRYTYSCLKALLKNIGGIDYEVIVVDDCSKDETPEMMKKIENAVYIRNEKNLGFIGSCNAGAKIARGEYVVFLNNDTHILPNWLESLIETFEKKENIGLAGSKLVYPDGRLQEAGGIVWKNKNVWNYGRFKDPENFEFNYLKDVDYCSGASLMLPKKLFEKLGGFDSRYMPGYFEDTDLAFQVRQAGFRTVYQPKSEVIHFEGVSNGKDLKKGVKKYQEVNKEKFFSRWKEVLEKENCADSEGPIFARDRSKGKKLMLFLDWNVPTFDKDAGSFVAFEYLKMLKSLGYKIIFWPHNLAKIEPYTETLQQMGIETAYGKVSFEKFMKEYGPQIDITLVSRPEVAKEHLDLVKQYSKGKVIYIAHDLHYLRMEREAEIGNDPEVKKKAEEMKALEKSIMKKSDISLFFSDKEAEIVKKELPGVDVDTMLWIQDMNLSDKFSGFGERDGIVFIGGFVHHPNIDSVIWFHDEIFPLIKKDIPNAKVSVIGSNPPQEILSLNGDDFNILGFVSDEDIPDIFNRSKVFVAPLRFGAGFKGKIAKAISFGLPVVTTAIGSEGIGLRDGETALIADNAEEFAEKIVKLYSDKELWEKISKNSMKHLQANFSTEAARKKFQAVLGELEK